jgi:hypothetical protein
MASLSRDPRSSKIKEVFLLWSLALCRLLARGKGRLSVGCVSGTRQVGETCVAWGLSAISNPIRTALAVRSRDKALWHCLAWRMDACCAKGYVSTASKMLFKSSRENLALCTFYRISGDPDFA